MRGLTGGRFGGVDLSGGRWGGVDFCVGQVTPGYSLASQLACGLQRLYTAIHTTTWASSGSQQCGPIRSSQTATWPFGPQGPSPFKDSNGCVALLALYKLASIARSSDGALFSRDLKTRGISQRSSCNKCSWGLSEPF